MCNTGRTGESQQKDEASVKPIWPLRNKIQVQILSVTITSRNNAGDRRGKAVPTNNAYVQRYICGAHMKVVSTAYGLRSE